VRARARDRGIERARWRERQRERERERDIATIWERMRAALSVGSFEFYDVYHKKPFYKTVTHRAWNVTSSRSFISGPLWTPEFYGPAS
jgi:hypothetical protein